MGAEEKIDGFDRLPIERTSRPIARLLLGLAATCRKSGDRENADELLKLVDESIGEYMELVAVTTPWEVIGRSRRYYKVENLNHSDTMPKPDDRVECHMKDANVVGSLCQDGLHRPVIDVDHPTALVPSSTPGHYHLYFDTGMTWPIYERLLHALVDAGVVHKFYLTAALARGQTFVRLPWVKKPKEAG